MMASQVVPVLRCAVVRRRPLEALWALTAANKSAALLREVLPDLGSILPYSVRRGLSGWHDGSKIEEIVGEEGDLKSFERTQTLEESWS